MLPKPRLVPVSSGTDLLWLHGSSRTGTHGYVQCCGTMWAAVIAMVRMFENSRHGVQNSRKSSARESISGPPLVRRQALFQPRGGCIEKWFEVTWQSSTHVLVGANEPLALGISTRMEDSPVLIRCLLLLERQASQYLGSGRPLPYPTNTDQCRSVQVQRVDLPDYG